MRQVTCCCSRPRLNHEHLLPRQVLVDEAGRVTAKKGEEAPSRPGNFLQRVSASMLPGRPDNA